MKLCLFASDLHGRFDRYEKLFHQIETLRPAGVFLGGDLTASMHPSRAAAEMGDFFRDFLADRLDALRRRMHPRYPRVFSILGNDDGKIDEAACEELTALGLWSYIDNRRVDFAGHDVYGYACVPPTPFALKDWERYDVSRYVPHGSVSPEEGFRSVPVDPEVIRYATIADDLRQLAAGQHPMDRAVFLFHTPPHETNLDRAALDGKQINGVPLDLHVGSIAVRRFIESSQPLLTLHGHIHESARLTGSWRDRIGRTHAFSAAHDGPELALVRFDLDHPHGAERLLR